MSENIYAPRRSVGIGTKILLPVGATFIVFTFALAMLIGITSFNNLTDVKLSELERMSRILANNVTDMTEKATLIVRSFERSERITREIEQLSTFGPYYANPNDYYEPWSIATNSQAIEDANQVFALQSSVNLITQLQVSLQTNNLDGIGFYVISPFDMISDSAPTLAFWLDHQQIVTARFPTKGNVRDVNYYQIENESFRSPSPNFFDISSVYSVPPHTFFTNLDFALAESLHQPSFLEEELYQDIESTQILFKDSILILQTISPIHVLLPHPDTWDNTKVIAGFIVIEQHLDSARILEFQNSLGLDVGFAYDGQIVVTNFASIEHPITINSKATVELDNKTYYFATEPIEPYPDNLVAVVFSPRSDIETLINVLQSQIITIATFIVGIGSVIVYISIQRLISHPLKTFTDHARDIEQGNFTSRVTMQRNDELGHLASAFNTMAKRVEELIGSLEERVNARTRDLKAAVEVSREITTVLSLDDLLPEVVKLTADTYQLYAVAILLPNHNDGSLSLSASIIETGLPIVDTENFVESILSKPSIIAETARRREAIIVNDVCQDERYLLVEELPHTKSELAIPMMLGNRFLGVFDVQSRHVNNFGDEEVAALQILAKQTAIAVRNAQLFEALRQAQMQAERANKAKSAFLASVSHELRTPLNSIINFTEFVRHGMKGPVTKEQVETLGEVVAASEHLLRLINDVLDMSKIESDSLTLYVEDNVDIEALIGKAISTAKSLIVDKPIVVNADIATRLPKIRGDEQRILQIMLNIVSNACKFTDRGEIRFEAKCEDDNIVIAIHDTGSGISLEDEDKVFEAFKQTESGQKSGAGTGLGMPISRVLAEEHGGKLWFEGAVGEGTSFYVLLPICPPHLELTT